ncbi:MAG: AAA family ATPase [Bdellovibrionales bacterium]|nr:AAA family ATPase [Bdellovibrionales bacterium]
MRRPLEPYNLSPDVGVSSAGGLSQTMAEVEAFAANFEGIEHELAKIIVGNKSIIRQTLAAIFSGGHVLLEGAPGLGKTLLVKSIAKTMGLSFQRIQFTSDLMPSDITGTQVLTEDEHGRRQFEFRGGPIFANIILADEVNRAGPKTQSALLEAMEEKQVSIVGTTHKLPSPFFVLATQNPVELEGTYPLPEAQLDRFVFKLLLDPPSAGELKEILARTTGESSVELKPIMPPEATAQAIIGMRNLVRRVVIAPPLEDVLVGLVFSLTPGSPSSLDIVNEYVRYGPGPRGAQSVLLSAKVYALLDKRVNLSYDDIKQTIVPALRHRLILNYQAEAEGVTSDDIIAEVIKTVA